MINISSNSSSRISSSITERCGMNIWSFLLDGKVIRFALK